MASNFQIRRIVSSFLTVGEAGQPSFRVALFKRSANRPVSPGLWAACSGKVEPTDGSPRAAAWREIREETGLESPLLELSRRGKMIELEDAKLRKMWHVYPFVFRMRVEGEGWEGKRLEDLVRLDEEHEEVRFVTVEEIKGMETVENLYESLNRVLEGEEER